LHLASEVVFGLALGVDVVLEEVAALVGGVAVRGFIVRGHGVDDVVVLAAPGGAGHVSGGGLDGLDGVSLGVEHHDAMAAEHGHPDVALAVHDHAVRLMGRVNEAAQHACVADVARLVVVVVRVDVLGARVVEVHGLLVRRPADAVAAHEAVRHLLDRPVRVVAPEAATRPAVVGGEVVAAVRQALDVDFRAPEAARGVHAPVVEAAHVALLLRDDLLQDLEPARLLVHERKALVVQADVRAGHVLAERHHRHAVLQVQHPQARLRPVRLRNRALGQLRASLDRLARLRVHRQNVQLLFWGPAPKPPWFRFAEGFGLHIFCEAEQRFLLLFLEKEELSFNPIDRNIGFFWGPAPKPPWFRFAEGLGSPYLLRSRTTLFASFSGKRRAASTQLIAILVVFWGPAPKPPWFRFAEDLGSPYLLRSRTNAFCFFFWKKKNKNLEWLEHTVNRCHKHRLVGATTQRCFSETATK
jgi:hypothetical protein